MRQIGAELGLVPDMHVRVDQAGRQHLPCAVDPQGAFGRGQPAGRPDGADHAVHRQHRPAGLRLRSVGSHGDQDDVVDEDAA